MKSLNLSNVQEAGESRALPAGGYICKYTNVTDVESKSYLYMEFDVAEGQHKGYYADLEKRAGFWAGKCYRSYKEKALPMFKRMCSAVSKSNPGYIFNPDGGNADETTLIGKYVGIVFGEEEYIGNDGSVKTRLYVSKECPIDDIRAGKFRVPEKKRLPQEAPAVSADTFMTVGDAEELPFD